MGNLHYAHDQVFGFDDRTLAHLRTVILGKFTLQESLVFTWNDSSQQRSLWLHPAQTLYFEFDSPGIPELNREWIESLMALANSSAGLRLVDEPGTNE
ncbi:hypothetical protein [Leucobacter sp. W1038]|uniref:DUF7882 family protein n=1 Tax=unclassified Leucobacter TaxID=2621730 RepID=UPI003D99D903